MIDPINDTTTQLSIKDDLGGIAEIFVPENVTVLKNRLYI